MSNQPLLLLWQHPCKDRVLIGRLGKLFGAQASKRRAEDRLIWIIDTRLACDVLHSTWIITRDHPDSHTLLLQEFHRIDHTLTQRITQNHRTNRPPSTLGQVFQAGRFIIKLRQQQHPQAAICPLIQLPLRHRINWGSLSHKFRRTHHQRTRLPRDLSSQTSHFAR